MKARSTLILVALGLAGVLFFLLVEEPRRSARLERDSQASRLTSVRPEQVERVIIERPDMTIEAERREGAWRLTSPVVDGMDESTVNVLVFTVCGAEVEKRIVVAREERSDFGLAPPAARLRFDSAAGTRLLEMRIGDLNPSRSHCYAAGPDADTILVLPAGVRRYALQPLFEFRDKRIVDVALAEVRRIEIISGSDSTAWSRSDGALWLSVQNGDTLAGDADLIESVVRRLRGLRAKEILSGDAAKREDLLTDPAGSIRLWTRGEEAPRSLTFSAPVNGDAWVIASGSGRIARVDTTVLPVFSMKTDDFRERRVARFRVDDLTRLVWEREGRALAIVKSDDAWRYTNPAFGRIPPELTRRILDGLGELRFARIFGDRDGVPAGYGFDAPLHRFVLLGGAERVVDEIVVGSVAPGGASRFVYSRSTGLLGTVDLEALTRLEGTLAELGGS